jgi:hypothetical protein
VVVLGFLCLRVGEGEWNGDGEEFEGAAVDTARRLSGRSFCSTRQSSYNILI